ncbi:MAG: hypothetical protein AAF333_11660 [Planctomycetota bacterium]
MRKPFALTLALIFSLLVTGCGSTAYFREDQRMTAASSGLTPADALDALFTASPEPLVIELTKTREREDQAKTEQGGLTGLGIGGLFLPLVLEVNALELTEVRPIDRGYAFKAKVKSTVNLIPPIDGKVAGRAVVRDDGTAVLSLDPFYSNWVGIGNVLFWMKYSVEVVDLDALTFSGSYLFRFHGTGNATGSGFYRASLGPPTVAAAE